MRVLAQVGRESKCEHPRRPAHYSNVRWFPGRRTLGLLAQATLGCQQALGRSALSFLQLADPPLTFLRDARKFFLLKGLDPNDLSLARLLKGRRLKRRRGHQTHGARPGLPNVRA